ncbi:MAG TPA: hydroxymethylbilane synthase [Chitinophagaceae bacterium]|nr:hydroxymethylbilane synthase [Chitinophagaceae bacterium]
MHNPIRIGTRESQLAVWQATRVQQLLEQQGYASELVYIRSEGDVDLTTPLYEMGVQGIFTRSLDIALLDNRIDLAVHSMKDVPTRLPQGITQAAVLERGPVSDLLVLGKNAGPLDDAHYIANIATSSIRRKAQWLHRYPAHQLHNLRGNVNTRLRKLEESAWDGAIFAQAGLERISLRPENSIVLNWMLPAPAQGAIVAVCREADTQVLDACMHFNNHHAALCTTIERDFLRTLLGGCSTPISALAVVQDGQLVFKGNILSLDGSKKVEIEKVVMERDAEGLGQEAAYELLANGGQAIADSIRND